MALYRLPGVHLYNVPRANRRADRIFRREIDDVLMYYSDNELHQRYRFSRRTIRYITGLVAEEISPTTAVSFCNKTSAYHTKIFGIRKLSASNRGHGCWLRQINC